MIRSFAPISSNTSKTLILGTMPGEKSLELNQYYGHGQNSFWKILFELHGQGLTADYDERKALLLENGLALWDVLKSCKRSGSLDSAITDEVANDFADFFEHHKAVEKICFNGKSARKFFDRHVGEDFGRELVDLPSTSPANASVPYAAKLKLWRNALVG